MDSNEIASWLWAHGRWVKRNTTPYATQERQRRRSTSQSQIAFERRHLEEHVNAKSICRSSVQQVEG